MFKIPPIPFALVSSTAFMMAFIAGLVDVFGFISLDQLFTAHITGNIVIAIAEIIHHFPGVAAKLIALPVFIIAAMIVTWIVEHMGQTKRLLVILLLVEACFLAAFMFAGFYVDLSALGSWQYISTGMLAVSAMAIHNMLLRTFMVSFPPCTVMTGNLCQFLVATVSCYWGTKLSYPVENLRTSVVEIHRFGNVLLGFMLGGIVAAVGFVTIGFWTMSLGVLLLVFMSTRVKKES